MHSQLYTNDCKFQTALLFFFLFSFFFSPQTVRHIGIKSLNPYLVSRHSVLINMENNDHRKGADGLKTENEDKQRDLWEDTKCILQYFLNTDNLQYSSLIVRFDLK